VGGWQDLRVDAHEWDRARSRTRQAGSQMNADGIVSTRS
jgi:hypothetical protein